jgi:anti-sigma B factor antagonist
MDQKLNIRDVGGVTVVDVAGRVTLGESAMTLRDGLRDLTAKGHKKVLLNLADVSFFDSTGIGVLVAAYATANSAGGHIKLCSLSKRVKDVLLITKLYTVFEVYDDEAGALQSFAESAAKA